MQGFDPTRSESPMKYDKIVQYRYDYDNAKKTFGNAFNATSKEASVNFVDYNEHFMGWPGWRKMVDMHVRYHYPKCVHTIYQREHWGYNTVKAVGNSHNFEPFNVEKEHKIINPH